jgi:hypothetical protein
LRPKTTVIATDIVKKSSGSADADSYWLGYLDRQGLDLFTALQRVHKRQALQYCMASCKVSS